MDDLFAFLQSLRFLGLDRKLFKSVDILDVVRLKTKEQTTDIIVAVNEISHDFPEDDDIVVLQLMLLDFLLVVLKVFFCEVEIFLNFFICVLIHRLLQLILKIFNDKHEPCDILRMRIECNVNQIERQFNKTEYW